MVLLRLVQALLCELRGALAMGLLSCCLGGLFHPNLLPNTDAFH
jgi:hypothetical protein